MIKLENEVIQTDALDPISQITTGMHFGDYSLLRRKPRNSSVLCLTDCIFAVIDENSYLKLIAREKLQLMT